MMLVPPNSKFICCSAQLQASFIANGLAQPPSSSSVNSIQFLGHASAGSLQPLLWWLHPAARICLGLSGQQLRLGVVISWLCLGPLSPLLHLSPSSSQLCLGSSLPRLHLEPSSIVFLASPWSDSAYATDFRAISCTSSLHPYGYALVLSPTIFASVLWHPGSTLDAHRCISTSASRTISVARSLCLLVSYSPCSNPGG